MIGAGEVEKASPLLLYNLQLLCVLYKSRHSPPSYGNQVAIGDPANPVQYCTLFPPALTPGPVQKLKQLVIVDLGFPVWCGEELRGGEEGNKPTQNARVQHWSFV